MGLALCLRRIQICLPLLWMSSCRCGVSGEFQIAAPCAPWCLYQVICVWLGVWLGGMGAQGSRQWLIQSFPTAAVIQVESSEDGKTFGHVKDAKPLSACEWTQSSFSTLQNRVGLLWSYCLCLLWSIILLGSDCAVVLFSARISKSLISRGQLHRDQWERHQDSSSIKPHIQHLISTRKGVGGIQQGASLFLCCPGTLWLDLFC